MVRCGEDAGGTRGGLLKFAVLQFFSWPGRRVALRTVYERALERVRIMDGAGYDAVWLAEHHFSTYSVCPSVHIMGMHCADITRRLRIGTGVSLAAFYHPLRLAEEVALLDNLSGGRVNWGAGRGFDRKEMEVFGVGREDSYARFRENVEVVLRAWRDGPLDYEGRFQRLPRRGSAAEAAAGSAADLDRLVFAGSHRLVGLPRPRDSDGPALHPRRDRCQVRPLSRSACRARPRQRPGHADGAAGGHRPHGRSGAGSRQAGGAVDPRCLRCAGAGRGHQGGTHRALRRRSGSSTARQRRWWTNSSAWKRRFRSTTCSPRSSATSPFCCSRTKSSRCM